MALADAMLQSITTFSSSPTMEEKQSAIFHVSVIFSKSFLQLKFAEHCYVIWTICIAYYTNQNV